MGWLLFVMNILLFFFFKQKTAYEMRISDWSSDVCSSDLVARGGPQAALLYIDLDQFKLINDTSGHLAGDQLLSQLALALAEHLRGDDILARLGGDEFGVLARDVDFEGVQLLAERRSEEHTSELQSLMRISYAVFCLKKKQRNTNTKKHKRD